MVASNGFGRMSNSERKGAIERRGDIAANVDRLRRSLDAEGRSMRADERESFERMSAEFTSLGERIRADDEARSRLQFPEHEPSRSGGAVSDAESRRLAFVGWARSQAGMGLKPEHREACRRTRTNPRSKWFEFRLGQPGTHRREMGVGTPTAGGYLVPQGFSNTFDLALASQSGVRKVCSIMRTETGATMPYPTVDDTANSGEMLGENIETVALDVPVGVKNFGAYKYSSKLVPVSNELMQDSGFGLEELIGQLAGERIGRITGSHYTTGNGTTQPQGIVTGAGSGITAASATVIDPDEVVRLYYSVDPAYRDAPAFGFMMHDQIKLQLMLMKDGEGRPLFTPSYRDGEAEKVLGKPVSTNQFMQATVATGTTTMLAGDFSKYVVRDAGTVRVRRLDERYAEKDQTGFLAFLRTDGKLLNSAAVKRLTMA